MDQEKPSFQRSILLMYISKVSGHRQATKAIEKSIKRLMPESRMASVNGFGETFPFLENVVNALYMTSIKYLPQIWDWMYDNPKVVSRSHQTRERLFTKSHSKIKAIVEEHEPDTIICSQAFPCGMVAHYKQRHGLSYKVIGVLTDYAPHSYWINEGVDYYVVPSEDTKNQLIKKGVVAEQIKVFGIPIRYTFSEAKDQTAIRQSLGLNPQKPTVLIMGGGHGLGPIKQSVQALADSKEDIQIMVIAGANKGLFKSLHRIADQSNKTILVYEYHSKIDELMEAADLIVTKPGGMTTAECLAKGLPMVIVEPLPGQEKCNTRFLLDHQIAVFVERIADIAPTVERLIQHPQQLMSMREAARAQAFPHSADDIAALVNLCVPEQQMKF